MYASSAFSKSIDTNFTAGKGEVAGCNFDIYGFGIFGEPVRGCEFGFFIKTLRDNNNFKDGYLGKFINFCRDTNTIPADWGKGHEDIPVKYTYSGKEIAVSLEIGKRERELNKKYRIFSGISCKYVTSKYVAFDAGNSNMEICHINLLASTIQADIIFSWIYKNYLNVYLYIGTSIINSITSRVESFDVGHTPVLNSKERYCGLQINQKRPCVSIKTDLRILLGLINIGITVGMEDTIMNSLYTIKEGNKFFIKFAAVYFYI